MVRVQKRKTDETYGCETYRSIYLAFKFWSINNGYDKNATVRCRSREGVSMAAALGRTFTNFTVENWAKAELSSAGLSRPRIVCNSGGNRE